MHLHRISRFFIAAILILAASTNATASENTPTTSASSRVTFERYSPLVRSTEIVRRTLSPIAADRVLGYLSDHRQQLPEQSIDLSEEHFWLYVPSGDPPAQGYGLIVFISPWDDGKVPDGWPKVLDQHRMVYVAADRSGNDFNMLWRRLPLALHAYENVSARFHIDPQRVYVSGFSGGSRTAMRAALSYPDVFRGAILNSGSDPFGNTGIAVPSAELFAHFQQRSRIVLVSGTLDLDIDARDAGMLDSAKRLCVDGVDTQPMLHIGHALMRASMLDKAIDALDSNGSGDEAANELKQTQCIARIHHEIDLRLAQVRVLLAAGDRKKAARSLSQVDAKFGGLAAPASVEIARTLLDKPDSTSDAELP